MLCTTKRLFTCFTLAIMVGCGSGETSSSIQELEALADQQDAQAELDAIEAEKQAKIDAADRAQARADALANSSSVSTEKGALGKKKAKSGGYLGAVAQGYLTAQQEVNNITVIHTLRTHQALTGKWPKSHDAFMKEIIDGYGISLEPLEEPYEYWYNAEDHTLYTRVKPEVVAQAQAEADAARADAEAAQNE